MNINFSDLQKIGEGSHWNVYRPKSEISISVEIGILSRIVIKISNEGRGRVEKNINTYKRVKEADLNTLKFYQSFNIDSTECIVAEDLNPPMSDIIYVSPNTARALPTPETIIMDALLNRLKSQDLSQQIDSAESYFKEKKISIIKNFDAFIDLIYREMEKATKNCLSFCEDAFFFGINPLYGNLQYKIADFDNIYTLQDSNTRKLYNGNTRVFLNSLWEFFDQFVDDTVAGQYKNKIEELYKNFK